MCVYIYSICFFMLIALKVIFLVINHEFMLLYVFYEYVYIVNGID